jgi:hypothetical protein
MSLAASITVPMIETAFKSLILPTGEIPFDSEELVE